MSFCIFGAHGPKMIEPLWVNTEHKVQWKRDKINLVELAKLRWIERWSVPRIAAHFKRSPETIQMHICNLRAGKLEKLEIPKGLRLELRAKSKEIFKGWVGEKKATFKIHTSITPAAHFRLPTFSLNLLL